MSDTYNPTQIWKYIETRIMTALFIFIQVSWQKNWISSKLNEY